MVRVAEEDATISVARNTPGTDENTRENMFIPANSYVVVSIIGTHYNRSCLVIQQTVLLIRARNSKILA